MAAVRLISEAQRYHQDADMAHDALHADVLEVLRATREGRDQAEALPVLRADVRDFRVADRAGRVAVPARLAAALVPPSSPTRTGRWSSGTRRFEAR